VSELSQFGAQQRKLVNGLIPDGRRGIISGWSSSERAHHRSELRKDRLKLSYFESSFKAVQELITVCRQTRAHSLELSEAGLKEIRSS
jgi:hypothetical protein